MDAKHWQKPKNAAITGSVVIEDSNFITECYSFFLREKYSIMIKGIYFTLAGEDKVYTFR
jgi:hypothetical protein